MPAGGISVTTRAKELQKEWESVQRFHPAWEAPPRQIPELVILEVRAKSSPIHGSEAQSGAVSSEPLHRILVERRLKFKSTTNDDIEYASIELRYARIGGWERDAQSEAKGSMSAGYARHLNTISLAKAEVNGTTGAVFLAMQGGIPRGMRIGTYLMNEIVSWAKHWPDANVQPIALVKGQAVDAEDRAIRNAFWGKFGFRLQFDDAEHREGRSLPMKARELTNSTSWATNIRVVPLLEFAGTQHAELTLARRLNADLTAKVARADAALASQRRHPFIWAWRVAYENWVEPYLGHAFVLLVVSGFAYGAARSFGWLR